MENRAKNLDSLKDEKYHERIHELKDKEEKLQKTRSYKSKRIFFNF